MTKKKLILYVSVGILTGILLSSLFPLNYNAIFGEPTTLSITIALLITVFVVSLIMFPIIKHYKKLEN